MTANSDAVGDSTRYDRVLVVERLGDPQSYTVSKTAHSYSNAEPHLRSHFEPVRPFDDT